MQSSAKNEQSVKFGLSEEVICKINAVFAVHIEIETAILYGSRAKGNYRPGSDIDITLTGDSLNLDILNSTGMQLDDLLLPYMIDLSIYSHIRNDELLEHIKRNGIVFYRKRPA